MAPIRDIVKALRVGAAASDLRAAKAVLEQARKDGLSPSEVKALAKLLDSPELSDQFSLEVRATLRAFLGGEVQLLKSVPQLVGELSVLLDATELPDRFAAELVLLQDQLLGRGLSGEEKAGRLFAFLAAYAERFVALATGESPARPEEPGATSPDAPGELGAPRSSAPPLGEGGQASPDAPGAPKAPPLPSAKAGEGKEAERRGDDGLGFSTSESTAGAAAKSRHSPKGPMNREEQLAGAKRFAALASSLGYTELKDARTGRTGEGVAFALASAASPQEVRRQVAELVPVPSGLRNPSAPLLSRVEVPPPSEPPGRTPERAMEPLAGTAAPGGERRVELERAFGKAEGVRAQPPPPDSAKVLVPTLARAQQREASQATGARARTPGTDKRLGKNLLWNVMHRFRGAELDESALEKDVWDQLAVGALLILGLLALGAVLLVSL